MTTASLSGKTIDMSQEPRTHLKPQVREATDEGEERYLTYLEGADGPSTKANEVFK